MGRTDAADAVLDPRCRVRGIAGLRVVDASIFPTLPNAMTNAAVVAVAERASDLIREDAALPVCFKGVLDDPPSVLRPFAAGRLRLRAAVADARRAAADRTRPRDRKSTRLNSSH